jgi:hypothetical protein
MKQVAVPMASTWIQNAAFGVANSILHSSHSEAAM